MSETPRAPAELRPGKALDDAGPSADRTLRDFRYVMASVNESASAVWADLWKALRGNVAGNGVVPPAVEEGFEPACGWAEFFEKFWLLKHYLDYMYRFCKE